MEDSCPATNLKNLQLARNSFQPQMHIRTTYVVFKPAFFKLYHLEDPQVIYLFFADSRGEYHQQQIKHQPHVDKMYKSFIHVNVCTVVT